MTFPDLDAYCRRIGYDGERAATLDVLRALHAHHTAAIPFENLNPLLGRPVRLDAESLHRKLVREGRGGYCFEQNHLFRDVLTTLGFTVVGLAGRVVWEGRVQARTHMLLRIDLDGQIYLTDVGFGAQVPTGPLLLEPDAEQSTPHESYRLRRDGAEFVSEAKIRGTWRPLYRFDLQEQLPQDYEVGNWYTSCHPDSLFVHHLMAARTAPGRRYALRNNELAVHHLNGETERRTLTRAEDLRETLEADIRITLPDGPGVDELLQRFVGRPHP